MDKENDQSMYIKELELRLEMIGANKPHNCAGDYVDRKTKEFWFCRKCGKVYKVGDNG